jgi:hypothetical protein
MSLKTLLVMPTKGATWVSEIDLPFPPFPGLGIRVDAYDVLNVQSVIVGDSGYDVTCIVRLEEPAAEEMTETKCRSFGFEIGPYP